MCAPGHYGDGPHYEDPTCARLCLEGHFCEQGAAKPLPCPPGTSMPVEGAPYGTLDYAAMEEIVKRSEPHARDDSQTVSDANGGAEPEALERLVRSKRVRWDCPRAISRWRR